MTLMASARYESWEKEISRLALFISIPQIISAPLSVAIAQLMGPANIVFDLKEIIDFLVVSFPLTLAIAMITQFAIDRQFHPILVIVSLVVAALLSNLLHSLVRDIPFVDLKKSLYEACPYERDKDGNIIGTTGIGCKAINWPIGILSIYWKSFGAILFIQALAIGIYIPVRISKKK